MGKPDLALIKFFSEQLQIWPGGLRLLSRGKGRTEFLAVDEISRAELLMKLGVPSDG